MKKVALIILLACSSLHGQNMNWDFGGGVGFNHVINSHELDLKGSLSAQIRATMQYVIMEKYFVKFGVGVAGNEVVGLRDYSVQLGCDNVNGTADTLNSYFEYGNQRIGLTTLILLGYRIGRFEIGIGTEHFFILRKEERTYLVECGEERRKVKSSHIRNTWKENTLTAMLNFEVGIALNKKRNIFLIPRVKYELTKTSVNEQNKFNEIQYELGLAYRIKKPIS